MKGRTLGYIENGRRAARYPCPSCQQRYRVGEPKVQDNWPAKLAIRAEQMDLLLIAAAEYIELCEEAGEYPEPIDFLDWVRPDAVNPGSGSVGSLRYLPSERQR